MNFTELSDEQILGIATPMMDNLMDASTNIDYEQHVRDFTDRLRAVVSPSRFTDVCERYQREIGFLEAREPLAVLKRPDSAVIIWKQLMSAAEGEYVAEMVLVQKNERYLVDHALFF